MGYDLFMRFIHLVSGLNHEDVKGVQNKVLCDFNIGKWSLYPRTDRTIESKQSVRPIEIVFLIFQGQLCKNLLTDIAIM